MGFLDGLFENKAVTNKKTKPISKEVVSRAVAGGNTWYGGSSSKWDVDRAVTQAYDRVIWVFRCVDAIASNQATVPIILKEYDTDAGHKIEDKDLSKLLNHRTNPFEDSWAFRYRLSSQLLLSTKGAFIELVRNGLDEVVEMYLLDPGSIEPIKDDKRWISGYKVRRANGSFEEIGTDDIVWVRVRPHPTDPYSQVTPITSAAIPIETDILARIFNRNFLKNDGRPGMLIGINGDISPEDAEELKSMFSGGYNIAGQTRVIEADNINVADLSTRPRDAQWNEATKTSKEDILLAFGVSESVLGNSSGRCLRATEKVHLSSGKIKKAQELVGSKFKLLQPTAEGELKEVNAVAEYAEFEDIYKITTFSGRTLETNSKHPLFMAASAAMGPFKRDIYPWGWTPMGEIKNHFDSNDAKGDAMFTEVAVPIAFDQTSENSFDYDSLFDLGAEGKTISDSLFTSDKEAQVAFISGLYSAHGLLSQHTSFDIYPISKEYADKLQTLLIRLGVHSVVSKKKMKHLVSISGKINMFNFLSQLELEGEAKDKAAAVWERLESDKSREHNAFRTDGLPAGMIWDRVYSIENIGRDQTVALTVEGDHSYVGLFWEHNTYNNADSEEENFWSKTMVPHCDSIARALEPLTGDDQDDKYLAFDYTTVDVLQRVQRRKEDAIKQDFARGIITANDVRKAMGLPEIDSPYARVLFHPSRLVGGEDPADVEAIRYLPVIGQTLDSGPGFNNPFGNTSATGGDGVVGGANDLVQGELAANGTGEEQQTINDQAARTLRSAATTGIADAAANPNAIVEVRERVDRLLSSRKDMPRYEVKQLNITDDPYRDLRNKMQGFIEGNLESWSNRQLDVVKDRVNHVKVRKGTRHWEGEVGTKELDTAYVVNAQEWVNDIHSGVKEKMLELLYTEYKKTVNTLSDQGTKVDLVPASISDILSNVIKQIDDAALNQSSLVAKHIGILDVSGKSITDIQSTLTKDSFDRSRWTTNLAKMVTTNSIESLHDLIYSNVEGKVFKIWCSGKDEHYRDGHGSLHGTKANIDGSFELNDKSYKYPTQGFDDEAINCSCWLFYGIDK